MAIWWPICFELHIIRPNNETSLPTGHENAFQHTQDPPEPSQALVTKTTRLEDKIAKLKEQMKSVRTLDSRMLEMPGQRISLTDPEAAGNPLPFTALGDRRGQLSIVPVEFGICVGNVYGTAGFWNWQTSKYLTLQH